MIESMHNASLQREPISALISQFAAHFPCPTTPKYIPKYVRTMRRNSIYTKSGLFYHFIVIKQECVYVCMIYAASIYIEY